MRTILRAGAIALAAGSLVLSSGVAAQAAAGTVTFSVNRLVFEPGQYGHTGSVRITIKNRTSGVFNDYLTITEPIASTFGQFVGTGPCLLNSSGRVTAVCELATPIQPGANGVVTINFQSPAKPQPFPQIAPDPGTVETAGSTAQFDAIFRSTTGKLANPKPYVQDTVSQFAVTANDVTLHRQEDGSFLGVLPVSVRSDSDAPNSGLWTELATPAGIDPWAASNPQGVCTGGGILPTPPDGFVNGCSVDGQTAEGETRTFEWVLTAPAGTPLGSLGTATALIGSGQTDGANQATVAVTIAE
ncbi:hypothetical protein [Actinoplanes sp. L3-i22]|uniref:hypothetical protein n=1 Tax=Actinoplanes sp. L3-i22 TaxID=2836373 RepID=UPI001C782713|nr:hypothetical protein [Actinoplanes sp. L3-i22]BCY10686.1 hypothetical protein L3i22_057740 [Actinoplanes sp. L3-i22]